MASDDIFIYQVLCIVRVKPNTILNRVYIKTYFDSGKKAKKSRCRMAKEEET